MLGAHMTDKSLCRANPLRVGLMGIVIWSIAHAPGADGQSSCPRFRLAVALFPCSHTALVVNHSLRMPM
jgi:hypothetical protein